MLAAPSCYRLVSVFWLGPPAIKCSDGCFDGEMQDPAGGRFYQGFCLTLSTYSSSLCGSFSPPHPKLNLPALLSVDNHLQGRNDSIRFVCGRWFLSQSVCIQLSGCCMLHTVCGTVGAAYTAIGFRLHRQLGLVPNFYIIKHSGYNSISPDVLAREVCRNNIEILQNCGILLVWETNSHQRPHITSPRSLLHWSRSWRSSHRISFDGGPDNDLGHSSVLRYHNSAFHTLGVNLAPLTCHPTLTGGPSWPRQRGTSSRSYSSFAPCSCIVTADALACQMHRPAKRMPA